MDPVLSPEGAAFIGAWEGFIEHCYDDSRGNCTVGIGHLVHMGATTQADRDHWGTLSLPHAIALLQADAHRNGLDALEASVTVQLTQGQVDALVSLCFNCGPGALAAGHAVATAVNSKPARWNPLDMKAWRTRVSENQGAVGSRNDRRAATTSVSASSTVPSPEDCHAFLTGVRSSGFRISPVQA